MHLQPVKFHCAGPNKHFSSMQSKLYTPGTINIWKKLLRKYVWADKNGLVFERLLEHQVKTWNLKQYSGQDFDPEFSIHYVCQKMSRVLGIYIFGLQYDTTATFPALMTWQLTLLYIKLTSWYSFLLILISTLGFTIKVFFSFLFSKYFYFVLSQLKKYCNYHKKNEP